MRPCLLRTASIATKHRKEHSYAHKERGQYIRLACSRGAWQLCVERRGRQPRKLDSTSLELPNEHKYPAPTDNYHHTNKYILEHSNSHLREEPSRCTSPPPTEDIITHAGPATSPNIEARPQTPDNEHCLPSANSPKACDPPSSPQKGRCNARAERARKGKPINSVSTRAAKQESCKQKANSLRLEDLNWHVRKLPGNATKCASHARAQGQTYDLLCRLKHSDIGLDVRRDRASSLVARSGYRKVSGLGSWSLLAAGAVNSYFSITSQLTQHRPWRREYRSSWSCTINYHQCLISSITLLQFSPVERMRL